MASDLGLVEEGGREGGGREGEREGGREGGREGEQQAVIWGPYRCSGCGQSHLEAGSNITEVTTCRGELGLQIAADSL